MRENSKKEKNRGLERRHFPMSFYRGESCPKRHTYVTLGLLTTDPALEATRQIFPEGFFPLCSQQKGLGVQRENMAAIESLVPFGLREQEVTDLCFCSHTKKRF